MNGSITVEPVRPIDPWTGGYNSSTSGPVLKTLLSSEESTSTNDILSLNFLSFFLDSDKSLCLEIHCCHSNKRKLRTIFVAKTWHCKRERYSQLQMLLVITKSQQYAHLFFLLYSFGFLKKKQYAHNPISILFLW
jgi:hypothetical protein